MRTRPMQIITTKNDPNHDCKYSHIKINSLPNNINICFININTYKLIAEKICKIILDDSWIKSLDPTCIKAYEYTVKETADKLNEICQEVVNKKQIKEDFGEIMVSIMASESLKQLFDHYSLPISELWKEKKSGNPGFDFHTICPTDFIHFGEAKYSSSSNPYKHAIEQAENFIKVDKHYRDIPHLKIIIKRKQPIENLVNKKFSIIAAFSINSDDTEGIIEKAVKKINSSSLNNIAQNIYLVGVIC